MPTVRRLRWVAWIFGSVEMLTVNSPSRTGTCTFSQHIVVGEFSPSDRACFLACTQRTRASAEEFFRGIARSRWNVPPRRTTHFLRWKRGCVLHIVYSRRSSTKIANKNCVSHNKCENTLLTVVVFVCAEFCILRMGLILLCQRDYPD